MADIQYLNYGDQQIEQQALLTSLANNVQSYVAKQSWSNKRKEKFMSAYSDIMNKGLKGASNTSGQWTIDVGDTIDLDSKSKKDREMYQEAAYFIQQQMSKLPTKSSQEKKDESELPKYDSFINNFTNYLSQTYYGGNPIRTQEDWNILDERNPNTGLRGTDKRVKRLSDYLKAYSSSLEEGKYNFEGSPFKDLTDLKTRINNAITKLDDGTWNQDDADALNAIGLRSSDWFNNGSGDPVTLEDGTTTTYGQLAEYNRKVAEAKKKQEEADKIAKQKAIRANQYDGYKSFNFLNGTPGSQEDFDLIAQKLANQQSLDGNELSKISWAFRQGMKNGGLSNLSKEELAKFGSRYANTPNRLKKLSGLEGIYYDSIGNRLVYPFKGQQQTGASLSGILEQNSPEALAKKEQENKLKAANRELSKGWETEDYLRMGAMAQDITGAITAWGGPYGMAASGLLGLTSLGTNMAADIADESLSKWDVAKNAGVNLGLAAVGMVPGLGLASRTGKWLTTIAKWAPRLLTIQALKDTPEVYASIKKAVDTPSKVTNQDWKNIAYGLSIAAGLSRGAKGIVNNRKYKPTVTQNTETETFITTKSGNKIKATQEQVDAINKAGRKGGNDKANEELRKLPGAKADDEVNINFKIGVKGKVDPTNKIKLDSSTKNIGQSPEVQRYSRALSIKNIRDKAAHPFLSKWLPTNYDIYQNATRVSTPNINIVDRVKQAWNPVPNRSFKGANQQSQHSSNGSTTSTSTNSTASMPTGAKAKPKLPVLSKEDSKELQSTLRGKNFSTNETKEAPMTVKGFGDIYGIKDPTSGKYSLEFELKDGTKVKIDPKDTKDIKSETLNVLRKDIMKKIDSQIPKEQRSRIKFELIKQLKENGYLKQGGTINRQKIQQYKEFIKK